MSPHSSAAATPSARCGVPAAGAACPGRPGRCRTGLPGRRDRHADHARGHPGAGAANGLALLAGGPGHPRRGVARGRTGRRRPAPHRPGDRRVQRPAAGADAAARPPRGPPRVPASHVRHGLHGHRPVRVLHRGLPDPGLRPDAGRGLGQRAARRAPGGAGGAVGAGGRLHRHGRADGPLVLGVPGVPGHGRDGVEPLGRRPGRRLPPVRPGPGRLRLRRGLRRGRGRAGGCPPHPAPYARFLGGATAMDGNRNPNPSFDGEVGVVRAALAEAASRRPRSTTSTRTAPDRPPGTTPSCGRCASAA